MSTTTTMTVYANVHWLKTKISLNVGDTVNISASGKWSANPAYYPATDANGTSNYKAKPGYALQNANESLLVGYIGDSAPDGIPTEGSTFALPCANGYTFNAPKAGTLFLTINDDILATYGRGYADNTGSLEVTITTG